MPPTTSIFPRTRWLALAIGLAASIACATQAFVPASRTAFFNAYLYAYLFWLGITLGSLALILLHNLTGGAWGTLLRRIAEPAARLLPLMAILFLPILAGMRELFPWARPADLAASDLLRHRSPYLNIPFFTLRAAIYFFAWILIAWIVRRLAQKLAAHPGESIRSQLRGWSAAGLILYLVTMTHAGYDWAMSRDTDFYSTTFGFIITVGQTLSALAFAILMLAFLNKTFTPTLAALLNKKPEQNPPEFGAPSILNDVGNILLTLVILWAYVSFMQLLVIWMGNSGEDNSYYLHRGVGHPSPWRWIGLTLVVVHFFVPFFLLLFRSTKKYLPALTCIAAVLFAAHLLEQYWLIAPSSTPQPTGIALTWIDFVTPLAIGGLWMAAYLTLLPASLVTLPKEISAFPSPPEGLNHA